VLRTAVLHTAVLRTAVLRTAMTPPYWRGLLLTAGVLTAGVLTAGVLTAGVLTAGAAGRPLLHYQRCRCFCQHALQLGHARAAALREVGCATATSAELFTGGVEQRMDLYR